MSEENTSKSLHLTELDFDISNIPNQLDEIGNLLDSYIVDYQKNSMGLTLLLIPELSILT